MEKVNDGAIKIRASKWPTFLYDHEVPYDPDNKDNGLCRGFVLVRVSPRSLRLFTFSRLLQTYRHIFTGPSSALGSHRRGMKPSKAKIHSLSSVTG